MDIKRLIKPPLVTESSSSLLYDRVIQIKKVTTVTKGGKKLSFRVLIAIGNKNGKVGIGMAKADEIPNAITKAKVNGIKQLDYIPLTKIGSIPHNIEATAGACHVILRPAVEGSGVSAGGAVKIICEVAGIKNIIAKQLGAKNLINNARATIQALKTLTAPSKILRLRHDTNLNKFL